MKRRVLVAQALVHRPRVIVLDEPTAGVDVELRDNLWRFIESLSCSAHDSSYDPLSRRSTSNVGRVAIMKDGRPTAVDHTDRLLASHAFERRLTCRLERGELPEGLLSLLAHRQGPELTL